VDVQDLLLGVGGPKKGVPGPGSPGAPPPQFNPCLEHVFNCIVILIAFRGRKKQPMYTIYCHMYNKLLSFLFLFLILHANK